jgi:hypothetical protein
MFVPFEGRVFPKRRLFFVTAPAQSDLAWTMARFERCSLYGTQACHRQSNALSLIDVSRLRQPWTCAAAPAPKSILRPRALN